jgi:hypothetical protein
VLKAVDAHLAAAEASADTLHAAVAALKARADTITAELAGMRVGGMMCGAQAAAGAAAESGPAEEDAELTLVASLSCDDVEQRKRAAAADAKELIELE